VFNGHPNWWESDAVAAGHLNDFSDAKSERTNPSKRGICIAVPVPLKLLN
jgi:hypothetical protein